MVRWIWMGCLMLLAMGAAMRLSAGSDMPDMPGMVGDKPPASAPATAPANVEVALSTSVEEGKTQLIATVKRDGKPVANARVSFGVKRTFGRLILGTDVTLDDGTAAVAFPSDLPGNDKGELELSAMVTGPLSQWGAAAQATMPGGRPHPVMEDPFPRALWAPSAPLGLICVIALLLCGAWGAYLFVIVQLLAIKRGAS
jgi:hypothetical protein